MRNYCTYFDSNYLAKGLTLYRSLVRHATPFRLWVLCFDDLAYEILKALALAEIIPISLQEFEAGDQELLQAKGNRSRIEYYFTCTPSLPLYVLDNQTDVDLITYLDGDLYFFSDPSPIYRELSDNSVLIIGHRFPEQHKHLEENGIYNVGYLSFRRDEVGLECLHWWRDRCLEWCYDRVEDGRFADQGYLDDWPQRFPQVVVLEHKGAGLAPWNVQNYDLRAERGQVSVDTQPLVFFHFARLKQTRPWLYEPTLRAYGTRADLVLRQSVYGPYIRELRRTARRVSVQGPGTSSIRFRRPGTDSKEKGAGQDGGRDPRPALRASESAARRAFGYDRRQSRMSDGVRMGTSLGRRVFLALPFARWNRGQWLWPLLPLLAVAYAWAIATLPFPRGLAVALGLPLIMVIWYDIRLGIGIWFALSTLGNMFAIDLPGFVPMRATHLVLLLLLAIWFIKSYRTIPAAVAQFLSTSKNVVLLFLLSWIALSMVMGRLTGVTQQTWKYQFNAWFSVALAFLLALLVSSHMNEYLLKIVLWSIIVLGTAMTATVLVTGILQGVGIGGWKTHYYGFVRSTELMLVHPLYLAVLFFSKQEKWGKAFFAVSMVLSAALHALMALSGSRGDLLPLITLGLLLLFTRPRLTLSIGLVAVLAVALLSFGTVESWINDQSEYSMSDDGVAIGKGTRLVLWRDAVQIIRRHPVWGTGSDLYRLHARVQVLGARPSGKIVPVWSTSAHNTWLQVAVDHGLPGMVLLALFCILVLRDVGGLYYRRTPNSPTYVRYILLFMAQFGTTLLYSPFGAGVLPVFTATNGGEEVQLASYLVRFWLTYGVVLGIEGAQGIERDQARRLSET